MVTIAIFLSTALIVRSGQPAGTVTLRLAPPVGRTYKYGAVANMKMTGSASRPGMNATVQCDLDMKVTARGGGLTSIVARPSKVKVSVPTGQPLPDGLRLSAFEKQLAQMTAKSRFDSHGHLVSMEGMGLEIVAQSFTYIGYPTGPVKIGQSWSSSFDLSKITGAPAGSGAEMSVGSIPISIRLEKLAHRGAQTIAELSIKIHGDSKTSVDGQTMNIRVDSTTEAFIDVADGMPVSLNSVIVTTSTVADVKVTQRNKQTLKRL